MLRAFNHATPSKRKTERGRILRRILMYFRGKLPLSHFIFHLGICSHFCSLVHFTGTYF